MKAITKAVITAGGYATRWLPISKAVPKEMLPLGNKPVIHYILAELRAAGITDVLILIGRGRESLLNYLDKNYEVDDFLARTRTAGRTTVATPTNDFADLNLYYRRVPLPQGVADCLHYAGSFVGNDPFVLAYCDDVFFDGNPTAELLADYARYGRPCLTTTTVPKKQAHQYGIVDDAGNITEKPAHPSSNLAAVGRYLLPGNFIRHLGNDLIAALNALPQKNIIITNAKRFDTGNQHGFFQAFKYIMSQN